MLFLHLTNESHPVLVPEWIEKACNNVTDHDTDKREADLPKIEAVVFAKDQRESTEKQVENSLDQRGVSAKS